MRDKLGRFAKGQMSGKSNPNWKEKIIKYCLTCKKKLYVLPCLAKRKKYCSIKCRIIGHIKKFTRRKDGRIFIRKPNHPFCNCNGHIMRSHLVIEAQIGRYLMPKEVVHHINGIKDDDRPENLYLFANQSKHVAFHNYHRKY